MSIPPNRLENMIAQWSKPKIFYKMHSHPQCTKAEGGDVNHKTDLTPKYFERLIKKRLTKYLETNNLYNINQLGFDQKYLHYHRKLITKTKSLCSS